MTPFFYPNIKLIESENLLLINNQFQYRQLIGIWHDGISFGNAEKAGRVGKIIPQSFVSLPICESVARFFPPEFRVAILGLI
jgi:hypothetical protein